MGYLQFLSNFAKLKHEQWTAKDQPHTRTPVPLNLSQEAAVEISNVPFLLLDGTDSLIKPPPQRHVITAVGIMTPSDQPVGVIIYNSYLSNLEGGFIQTSNKDATSARLFHSYFEAEPSTEDEWAFYLDDKDGYIGYGTFQSTDQDGKKQYHRRWSPGDKRIPPIQYTERVINPFGVDTVLQHRMMLYSRSVRGNGPLGDTVITEATADEYLLVSAVTTDTGSTVNLWLGIDIPAGDLTVYPATNLNRSAPL